MTLERNSKGQFMSGVISWNKGKHHTKKHRKNLSKNSAHFWLGKHLPEEMREKMSEVAKGRKMSNETKRKLSKINKGKRTGKDNPSWRGGKPRCRDCGKQLSAYNAKYCNKCFLVRQFKLKEPTSIEKKVYNELKERGFLFEKQKLINGKFLVDAYIPSLNLIIEADGDYWHGLDRVIKKDKAENAYLTKCGYGLIRLSENEINNGNFKNILDKRSVN